MSRDQDQDQDQDQLSAGTGGGFALRSVPGDLPFHVLTFDFTPVPGHPHWPLRAIPAARFAQDFDDRLWDPSLYALQLLQDFVDTDWVAAAVGSPWRDIAIPPSTLAWKGNPVVIEQELEELRVLMENERQRYLAEIVAQANSAEAWWLGMLGITRSSKPHTFRLIAAALRIGEYVGMYFKNVYRRVRPSVLAPGLQPPFGPPGHPSFPNNHCLQGSLVSRCLEAVTPQDGGQSIYQHQLEWLAWRVGVNRERAGLHYRSDTRAGHAIASALFDNYLNKWPNDAKGNPSRFTALMDAARGEWP